MDRVYEEKYDCCGCTACYSACPVGAITLEEDEKGFVYPVIDKEKCINCGKCKKVCPLNKKIEKVFEQKCFGLINKDLNARINSSSGGFFIELAKYVIENDGLVYGAIYDENLKVVHTCIDNMEELYKFSGSKYVQSDIKGIYKDIKEKLKNKRMVLFSGTPCQNFGLINYLGKSYDNLITCDFVCHGVPSPKLFDDHKQYLEKKYDSKIKSVNFRYKNEKNIQNLRVLFETGEEYIRLPNDDEYYFLFAKNFILRDSCYKCHFSNTNRISDITMSDFWAVKNVEPSFDDGKGLSCIIVNTEKGFHYFEKINDKFDFKEFKLKDCLQPNLISPTKEVVGSNLFWKAYKKFGYTFSVKVSKGINFINRVRNKIKKKV